jgi:hypothetical protein
MTNEHDRVARVQQGALNSLPLAPRRPRRISGWQEWRHDRRTAALSEFLRDPLPRRGSKQRAVDEDKHRLVNNSTRGSHTHGIGMRRGFRIGRGREARGVAVERLSKCQKSATTAIRRLAEAWRSRGFVPYEFVARAGLVEEPAPVRDVLFPSSLAPHRSCRPGNDGRGGVRRQRRAAARRAYRPSQRAHAPPARDRGAARRRETPPAEDREAARRRAAKRAISRRCRSAPPGCSSTPSR